MPIGTDHREYDQTGQPLWAAPVLVARAIIDALLHFLAIVARLKAIRHTTRFKPSWRDHWPDLRKLEWHRARMRAIAAEAFLNGQNLDDLPPFEMDDTVPGGFGGPCPTTPFEMNRRFLSLAKFRLDPHADIKRYVRRLAKRAGINLSFCPLRHVASHATSTALRAEEENTCASRKRRSLSSSDAQHRGRWQTRSCAADGGGGRRITRPAAPRAPPTLPISSFPASAASRLRSPPLARVNKSPKPKAP